MIEKVPSDLARIFDRFIVTEYAYFTPKGEPLCWPVTPYWNPNKNIISIATGLAYPTKADYAKKNPKVALLFSASKGSGLPDSTHVLVQGDATVRDENIQENTDRYVSEMRRKFPQARLALNGLTVKMLDFYLPRLWVEVSPVRIISGAGSGRSVIGPPLPEPVAEQAHDSKPLPRDELAALFKVASKEETGVLTMKGGDGYPYMQRVYCAPARDRLEIDAAPASGPACLTLHHHSLAGTRFSAYLARGAVLEEGGRHFFVPRRLVGFFGNGAVFPLSVIPSVRNLRKRLRKELAKRDQPMPILRVP
ncbi:MAG TPA: hypothetical protein VND22_02415 [Actinomycetota bacterium]|nr:hypothetical protein [Actinomycetota bacterium]